MRILRLHSWPRTPRAAIALQMQLAGRVSLEPLAGTPELLAGVDAAFSRDGRSVVAGVVVWSLDQRRVVESRVARAPLRFPYVPGLLSFRELPGVLAALRALRTRPHVVLCDAHGLAHPRRFGLACHLGLWLDLPTIGCAKTRLCGAYAEPASSKGAQSPLVHDDEVVGAVLRTRARVKPVFVSAGHRVTLPDACFVTLLAVDRYRLPEPTRLAHRLVTLARRT